MTMNTAQWELMDGTIGPVDVLAVGPHPDDLEIGAGGALLLWISQGYRVGLVDLTRGELGTKSDAAARRAESIEAAHRMGATFRVNLGLPDGSVVDDDASRARLVDVIRQARPTWVVSNKEESRHPDHAAGARLVDSAFFLARLPKYLPSVPAHSPKKLFYYLIHDQATPTMLVDISPVVEAKRRVMEAHVTQFVDPKLPEGYVSTGLGDYLANVKSLGESWGAQGGVAAAEAFVDSRLLVVRDFSQWLG